MAAIEIADSLGIHRNHVAKWRKRFMEYGIDGLMDKPRSGKPSAYADEDRHRVVTLVCTTPPKGLSRWSIRILAKAARVSASYVQRVLKEHEYVRHGTQTMLAAVDIQSGRATRMGKQNPEGSRFC